MIAGLFIYINAGHELEWWLWKEFSSYFMIKTLIEAEIHESNDLFVCQLFILNWFLTQSWKIMATWMIPNK